MKKTLVSTTPQFRFTASDFEGLQYGATDLLTEMFAMRANQLLEGHLDQLDETICDAESPPGFDDVYLLWPIGRRKCSSSR